MTTENEIQAQGTVFKVDSKKTEKGKAYLRVDIDGTWYSCWELALFPVLTPGQYVQFTYVTKGDFSNIIGAQAIPRPASAQQEVEDKPNPPSDYDAARRSSIEAQKSLDLAVQLFLAGKLPVKEGESPSQAIETIAKRLNAILKGLQNV